MLIPEMRAITSTSAYAPSLPLPLLVARIRADDKDPSLTTDNLALLAHGFDRGSYLHSRFALVGKFHQSPARALAAAKAAATRTERACSTKGRAAAQRLILAG